VDKERFLPLWVAVGVPLMAACTNVVEPALPSDAQEFSPPPVYSTWWNMTQACSALTGSLGAVTWYQTNTVVYDTHSGDVIAGYWEPGSNRIVLTSSVMMDGGIVRHEMLHALIRKGGHPRGQFLGNCSGTVVSTGVRNRFVDGTSIISHATSSNSGVRWSVTAIMRPLRDSTSFRFDIVFSKTLSLGIITTTGISSSISAIGPCFISPAE